MLMENNNRIISEIEYSKLMDFFDLYMEKVRLESCCIRVVGARKLSNGNYSFSVEYPEITEEEYLTEDIETKKAKEN